MCIVDSKFNTSVREEIKLKSQAEHDGADYKTS